MFMRSTLWILLVILISVGYSQASASDGNATLRKQQQATMQEYGARLDSLRAAIDTNHGSRADQLEEYLDVALGLVYMAKAQANADRNSIAETNADLSQLVELGYLTSWPANPLNDWLPMRVLTPADPFSAGDLVLELCPPVAQSRVKGSNISVSFNIYVYGLEDAGYGPVQVFHANEIWSRPPTGALNGHSYYLSSTQENAERKLRTAERKAGKAASQASNGQ
jgi:hypothetical protein